MYGDIDMLCLLWLGYVIQTYENIPVLKVVDAVTYGGSRANFIPPLRWEGHRKMDLKQKKNGLTWFNWLGDALAKELLTDIHIWSELSLFE